MKKTRITAALFLAVFFTLSSYSTVFSQERQRYPLMRPDAETLAQWIRDYETAPKAPEAPKLLAGVVMEGEAIFGGSLSLLNNIQYTPSQRDQGSCGNCWAWAGTGVLELALYAQRSLKDRLSVQFLDSCKTGDCACEGGNLNMFASFYNSKGFAVPWLNEGAAYADGGGTCSTACGSVVTTPNYPFDGNITVQTITTTTVSQAEAIANIKNILNQGKGVWFAYFLADDDGVMGWDDFFDYWYDNGESILWDPDPYCGVSTPTAVGHAVLIVGYNDDDPDPAKHYWIALNSWATAGGGRPNGLFRMKMRMNYGCTITVAGDPLTSRFFQTLIMTFLSCSYALSESGKSFTSTGSSGSVNVTAGETCDWTAMSNNAWITITAGASGTGNGTVSYDIDENEEEEQRTGTITISDQTYTVTQAGVPPPSTTTAPASGEGGGGGCFIATAAFGSPMEPHVQILRDFRDRYLRGHEAGNFVVRSYEDLSPPVARFISDHEILKGIVRLSLLPLIGFAFVTLHLGGGLFVAAGFFGVLSLAVSRARCRRLRGTTMQDGR